MENVMLTSLTIATTHNEDNPCSAIAPNADYNRDSYDFEPRVLANRQLVRKIAWNIHSRMSGAIEVEDLMQIGLIALVEAARVFEDRGVAFSTYASTRIRGAMIDALRRDAPMSRKGMQNRRKLASVRADLEQRLMRAASDAEIAAEMQLGDQAYRELVASTSCLRPASIDDSYSDHDIQFSDGADLADDIMEKAELSALLRDNLAKLSEREQLVLSLYFVEEMNLDEIGLSLDVGAARVCQIKKAAIEKLRDMMDS